jgi:hypothetical protein
MRMNLRVGGVAGKWVIVGFAALLVAVIVLTWQSAGPSRSASPVSRTDQGSQDVGGENSIDGTVEGTPITEGQALLTPIVPDKADLEIDGVIRAGGRPQEMAAKLLRLLPSLDGPGQAKAASHIVHLVRDDEHAALLAGLLQGTSVDGRAQVVLFQDLLNRPQRLQWPIYTAVLQQPSHPLRERVISILRGLSNRDHGNDTAAWLRELEHLRALAGG